MRLKAMIVAAAVSLMLSTPASAQWWPAQGPWNVHAQKRMKSYGAPPRNAQCGWYMGRHTGHSRRSLWLAQNWAREFPRAAPAPGRVVVWNRGGRRGHVAKIVSMQSRCRAVVHDNRGTYARDICRGVMAYVRV